jgi:uncharacterized membrane protein YhaH (DUF805 family)
MNSVSAFFLGLAITAALGFSVVWYLRSHLRGILVDLCGTEARADFWMAFSNVVLILVPMIFGMQFQANPNLPAIFQLNYQLKWVFTGLVVSVMSLGAILSLFIRRDSAPPPAR